MSNRWLRMGLVLMVVLNAVTITLLLTGAGHHHRGGPPHPHRPPGGPDRIAEELHFNEAQTRQFETMRRAHHQQLLTITDEMVAIRRQVYSAPSYADSLRADSLIQIVAAKSAALDRITYQHFADLRKLCDPGQQKIFDDVISDFASHIGSPMGNHPPPHD